MPVAHGGTGHLMLCWGMHLLKHVILHNFPPRNAVAPRYTDTKTRHIAMTANCDVGTFHCQQKALSGLQSECMI